MRKQTSRRHALALAMTAVAFALGLLMAVFVAGSASASGPLPSSTTTSSTTPAFSGSSVGAFDPNSPQAQFLVINGTVSAASDHEIIGSSAFPNFTSGAVDNYYSMSRSYMDNSPFNEGTASPADTGPVGQTAAAGNTQQPQYADARWPGGPDQAEYGKSGNPFAEAGSYEALATADASEATNSLNGPGLDGTKTLSVPKGFDNKLQQVLSGWKTKYLNCPPAPKTPATPKVTVPKPPKVTVPKPPKVTTPTVTTPIATVAAPHTAAPSTPSAPSVSVPAAPTAGAPRSLSAVPSPCSAPSGSGSDGESLLQSSALGVFVPGTSDKNNNINKVNTDKLKTTPAAATTTTTDTSLTPTTPAAWKPKPYTMLLGGESSLGQATLGHGQIVIDGIHVTASVANDGTAVPSYKANISVASATIGGVPVTIDQDGVHLAGHTQGVPYKQASDGLNTALKQAGIEIFLVAPQITNCGPTGGGTGTSTTATTTTTDTTTTSDQSGATSPCDQGGGGGGDMCGSGTGTDTSTTTTSSSPTPVPSPTSTDQSGTSSAPSCPPPDSCGSGTGTGTTTGGSTTTTNGGTGAPAGLGGSTTTTSTTSTTQTDTTSTTSSSCPSTMSSTSSCAPATGKGGGASTTSSDQSGSPAPSPMGGAMGSASQETIISATGVHVVFTQPVSPPGVPAQFVEHILGEVYVDSLAAPATPLPAIGPASSSPFSSSSSSSCPGGKKLGSTKLTSGGGGSSSTGVLGSSTSGGSSLAAGSGASGGLAGSGSSLGAASPTSGSSTGGSLPAQIASALTKPLWLLLAYLVWQSLVIGTGLSLWNWRKEGP